MKYLLLIIILTSCSNFEYDYKAQERICEKNNARHCVYMNYSSRD